MAKPKDALEQALALLKFKDLTEFELRTKLSQRGYPEAEVERALASLKAYHYLDDKRVEKRETERLEGELAGRQKIEAKLQHRGLNEAQVETDLQSEKQKALNLLGKRVKPGDSFAKAGRLLAAQGYEEETIREALEEFFPDQSDWNS
ncbi:MAG: recombination regulator RecX [Fimbriimonadaceae bacterium]|jgi:regulatory protein|nr:recombination regulator RecX [Fimbriimonadaceae bacterium]